jgi:tRNA pseudouridine55 synthase
LTSIRVTKRRIDGVLVLNKSPGMSSNQALQKAKWLLRAEKAGHTGSLDPFATGVLPLCFGEATKFSQFLLDADKAYRARICLGISTSTGDLEGEVISQQDASAVALVDLEVALNQFRGPILQVPPMVSALKVNGQPLYKLARKGQVIERQARPVTIHTLELLAFTPGEQAILEVNVRCSKGTYIRSIAQDLGDLLKVGGHVLALHRTGSGVFDETNSVTLCELEDLCRADAAELPKLMRPMDAGLEHLPKFDLAAHWVEAFGHGQTVTDGQLYRLGAQGDKVRVFREDGVFLGLGEIADEGQLRPRRLVVLNS